MDTRRYPERPRRDEIRTAAAVQPITTHLMQKRIRWCGHVRLRDGSHMTRTVLGMDVEGVRPRGRPELRYMENIRIYIKKIYTSTFFTARTGQWQYPGRPGDVEEPAS